MTGLSRPRTPWLGRPRARKRLPVNLALQGGGAHGAFTWGVLDRLLEEETLHINALSGTSAGAMNAAVLASGFAAGGRQGAKEALDRFWRKVSRSSRLMQFFLAPAQAFTGGEASQSTALLRASLQVFSPYDLNPAGFNPLRRIISESVDFAAVARAQITVFVTATHVRTGEARIFSNPAISLEVLLATSCLPSLFHAVEIEEELYWDGGYSGNPSLMPLVWERRAADLILVQLNPLERPGTPRSARDIAEREKEIAFNTPLLTELRTIAEMQSLLDAGDARPARMGGARRQSLHSLRLHRIASGAMEDGGSASAMNTKWSFLAGLRDEGRAAAAGFLQAHRGDLGQRSSFDLSAWQRRVPG